MNIGIDHGYYAIKTRHFSFPAGIAEYSHEPYTLQNTLEFGGKFYVCGTGRQPILRNKMENDNYYLLTLAAIAKEIKQRGGKTECSVRIAAGLPLAGFGREKKPFREYLLRSSQPVCFKFEGIAYKITIEDVKLFPQGYSAIALHSELIQNEPSVLLMDIGGWTVDLMRLDNGVPNAATCRSLELGMIRCIDETKEQVRRDTGLSVTDAQVERVLTGKPCSMDEDARNIIQKQGRLYKESLLSAAMESGFDLKAIPVVMLGGGASVVKGNVSEQDSLCRVFALIDDKVNAEGFERILGQFSGGVGNAYEQEFKTDENGEINLTLRVGEYTVSEVAGEDSEKYILPDDQTVEIKAGETTTVKMHNKLVPEVPSVPQTGDNPWMPAILGTLAGLAVLSGGALLFLRYTGKKRKSADQADEDQGTEE